MQHNKPQADAWREGGLTIRGAVEWSGLGRTSIYMAIARGDLIVSKQGKRTIVSRASLRALLAAGATGDAA